jgi:hypothetical protein
LDLSQLLVFVLRLIQYNLQSQQRTIEVLNFIGLCLVDIVRELLETDQLIIGSSLLRVVLCCVVLEGIACLLWKSRVALVLAPKDLDVAVVPDSIALPCFD